MKNIQTFSHIDHIEVTTENFNFTGELYVTRCNLCGKKLYVEMLYPTEKAKLSPGKYYHILNGDNGVHHCTANPDLRFSADKPVKLSNLETKMLEENGEI